MNKERQCPECGCWGPYGTCHCDHDIYGEDCFTKKVCPECDGKGGWMSWADNADVEVCTTCKGTGEVDAD